MVTLSLQSHSLEEALPLVAELVAELVVVSAVAAVAVESALVAVDKQHN
jgi:hypothetical protein